MASARVMPHKLVMSAPDPNTLFQAVMYPDVDGGALAYELYIWRYTRNEDGTWKRELING